MKIYQVSNIFLARYGLNASSYLRNLIERNECQNVMLWLHDENFVYILSTLSQVDGMYVVRASLLGNNQDSMKYSKFYETIGNKVVFLLSYCQ